MTKYGLKAISLPKVIYHLLSICICIYNVVLNSIITLLTVVLMQLLFLWYSHRPFHSIYRQKSRIKYILSIIIGIFLIFIISVKKINIIILVLIIHAYYCLCIYYKRVLPFNRPITLFYKKKKFNN